MSSFLGMCASNLVKGGLRFMFCLMESTMTGSIVNMGLKDEKGNVCYIIGLLKAIRKELGKSEGDLVHVIVAER